MILQIATVDVGNQLRFVQDGEGASLAWVADIDKVHECQRVEFVDLEVKRTRLVAQIDHARTHRMVEDRIDEYRELDLRLKTGHTDRWTLENSEHKSRLLNDIRQGRIVIYYFNTREVNLPPRSMGFRNPVRYIEEN